MAETIARPCGSCGSPFIPKRRDQRTCGAPCRRKLNNDENNAKRHVARVPIACLGCGQTFLPPRSDSSTCSRRCWRRVRHVRAAHDRRCPACGQRFTAGRSDRQACSPTCTQRLWRLAHPGQHRLRNAGYGRTLGVVSERDWQRQIKRQRGRCFYCDDKVARMEMDHVIPLARGGRHSIGNVVLACPSCNNHKGQRLVVEWRHAA